MKEFLETLKNIFESPYFSGIATVVGLLGDAAVLYLTIYTLHITAFARKLELISPSIKTTTFYGNSMAITVMNKSLHAIPVQSVFVMKRHNKKFYYFSFVDYPDPIIIDSWSVKRIETEPFTEIDSWDDNPKSYIEIVDETVFAVKAGKKILWVKPYKKAPLRAAKKAYKKHKYELLTVAHNRVGDTVVSQNVDCIVSVLDQDVNGQNEEKTILGITGTEEGGTLLLSHMLGGYNSFRGVGETPDQIRESIISATGIERDRITVAKVKGRRKRKED